MSELRDFEEKYKAALALPNGRSSKSETSPAASALTRAHELRKFEIENYWRRATYFWAFQIASFGLLGLIWRDVGDTGGLERSALLLPCGLGAISAQVGWLTAKGSKFWQENWEAHVDILEREQEGRLTQVVLTSHGPQFSVSGVNQNFMLLLLLGWLAAFVVVLSPTLEASFVTHLNWLAPGILLACMVFLIAWSRTSISGWRLSLNDVDWHRHSHPSMKGWFESAIVNRHLRIAPQRPQMILRDTLSGKPIKPEVIE